MNSKVLFVDDEPNILHAYSRTLRKQFDIVTATSGAIGLEIVANDGPFAVVVSDMRMPKMDGIEFLSKLKQQAPDTVRIMLTGNADLQTAIDAVNKGDIFRFLNKPCSKDNMADSLNSAIEQYRLINAEQELLEKTVKGSIAALSEVLSLSKPDVFGRTAQYKSQLLACAKLLGIEADWQLETMAMLSLIGTVSLPDELVKKALSGTPLSTDETQQFNQHPQLGAELLSKIPRMESLAEGVRYQLKNFDGTGYPEDSLRGASLPLGARLLRVIIECDILEQSGLEKDTALDKMAQEQSRFDPRIVNALAQVLPHSGQSNVREISVAKIHQDMILARDVLTKDGALLVCKGQQLTPSVSDRLIHFWTNDHIAEKLLVVVPATNQ